MQQSILVIDDEADICSLISDILKDEGYDCRTARGSRQAFEHMAHKLPSAIVLDIWLESSELDGLGILEIVKERYPDIPVVVISGHANIETAVSSIRLGAYDFIEKPFKAERLVQLLRRAIEATRLRHENLQFKSRYAPEDELQGSSPAVLQLCQAIERVAPTNSRVFITGGAGVGKQIAARMIHDQSNRRFAPFMVCQATSSRPEQLAATLFGLEEGGIIAGLPHSIGLFEKANGGTVFIDEVAALSMPVQQTLLRILQDQMVTRIGGKTPLDVDVRVLAATRHDPVELMAKGLLKEELFYRLNVVPLKVPPLRERREDIPLLTKQFLAHFANTAGMPRLRLSDDAVAAMQAYEWPGNIRELRNVAEWMLIQASLENRDVITADHLPKEVVSTSPAGLSPVGNADVMSVPLKQAREMFEREYLTAQINRFGGNISRTSAFVGMERSALHRKLKSLNVTTEKEKVEV